MTETSIVVDLDGVVGDTGPIWEAFLAHLARRFAAIEPLEPSELAAERTEAAEQLDTWAASGIGDWRGQLTRFCEDHMPVYLRTDAKVAAALRSLGSGGADVKVVSDAPQELVDVAASHLGLVRLVTSYRGGVPAGERCETVASYVATRAELEALLSDASG